MLGYITVGNSGATTLTFNATSIQNAIILGLFILVLGALVLPLFGISMGETEETGYGYGYEQPAYAYEECTRIRLCQEVGGLNGPRSSGYGICRGEIRISLQTSGIPTFKFLLFKSTHLFSNLAIIFFFYSSPS